MLIGEDNCKACLLHCSWIGPRLSSQLPVIGSAPGEAGSPQIPAHTAADAGADEREDEAEEDTYDHNSCNYPRSETGWLTGCGGRGVQRKCTAASHRGPLLTGNITVAERRQRSFEIQSGCVRAGQEWNYCGCSNGCRGYNYSHAWKDAASIRGRLLFEGSYHLRHAYAHYCPHTIV